jgi:hypothetical protein
MGLLTSICFRCQTLELFHQSFVASLNHMTAVNLLFFCRIFVSLFSIVCELSFIHHPRHKRSSEIVKSHKSSLELSISNFSSNDFQSKQSFLAFSLISQFLTCMKRTKEEEEILIASFDTQFKTFFCILLCRFRLRLLFCFLYIFLF